MPDETKADERTRTAGSSRTPPARSRIFNLHFASRLGFPLLGDEILPALRPVAATFFVRVVGGSAIVSYQGVWAATHLHVRGAHLGAFFAAAAAAGVIGGYAGGHVSDLIGRTRVIVAGYVGAAVSFALVPILTSSTLAALALVVAAAAAYAFGNAAHYALAADVASPADQERAFATMRVVQNLGVVLGPLVASVLVRISWSALFIGSAVTIGAAVTLGARLPRAASAAGTQQHGQVQPSILIRDRVFLVFWSVNLLAACTYAAYETLLPVSATTRHGLQPALWGIVLIVNPLMVIALQLRLTRWTREIGERLKLAAGCVLMGTPFLLLAVYDSATAFVIVLAIFVTGEMLWVPASSATVVRLAPVERRGAYLGAFNTGVPLALTLVPLIGFPVADAAGDTAMWGLIAAIGIVAATSFAAVVHVLRSQPALHELEVAPTVD